MWVFSFGWILSIVQFFWLSSKFVWSLRETNNTHNTAATCATTIASTLGRSVCVIVEGGRRRKQRKLLELAHSGNKFNVNRLLWWKRQRFYVLLSSFRWLLKVKCNSSWRFKLCKRADFLSIHSPRFRILHSPTTTLTKAKKKSLEKIIQANQEGETRRHRLEETNIGKVLWEKVVSRLAVIARSLARGDEEKRKASGRTKTQQKPASSRMLCKSHKCVKGRWISSINVVCVLCPAEVNTHTFTWAYWVVNVFVMIIIKTLLPMMVQWVYSFALSLLNVIAIALKEEKRRVVWL